MALSWGLFELLDTAGELETVLHVGPVPGLVLGLDLIIHGADEFLDLGGGNRVGHALGLGFHVLDLQLGLLTVLDGVEGGEDVFLFGDGPGREFDGGGGGDDAFLDGVPEFMGGAVDGQQGRDEGSGLSDLLGDVAGFPVVVQESFDGLGLFEEGEGLTGVEGEEVDDTVLFVGSLFLVDAGDDIDGGPILIVGDGDGLEAAVSIDDDEVLAVIGEADFAGDFLADFGQGPGEFLDVPVVFPYIEVGVYRKVLVGNVIEVPFGRCELLDTHKVIPPFPRFCRCYLIKSWNCFSSS